MPSFHPATIEDVHEVVSHAVARRERLSISGGGSKRALGRPTETDGDLVLERLAGIVSYEPAELVLTAKAGTPRAEIETALAERDQMLAFEPPDWRVLLGDEDRMPTLGGVLACNLAGPRRVKTGAARDHFLGFSGVNGFGQIFKAGGKVVKNVTGYDVCKLMAGSYGTLAVIAEATVKVVPRPETSATLVVAGLDDASAVAVLADGLNSPHEVSAAAHVPQTLARHCDIKAIASTGTAMTALRIEGPETSVRFRLGALRDLLAPRGDVIGLGEEPSRALWRRIGDVAPLLPVAGRIVWRLSLPPAAGPAVLAAISERVEADGFYDWGGGLVWVSVPDAGAEEAERIVRAAVATSAGHAMLVRAPQTWRARLDVFEPLPAPLAALTRRVKESFDPQHLLNPGRMYRDL